MYCINSKAILLQNTRVTICTSKCYSSANCIVKVQHIPKIRPCSAEVCSSLTSQSIYWDSHTMKKNRNCILIVVHWISNTDLSKTANSQLLNVNSSLWMKQPMLHGRRNVFVCDGKSRKTWVGNISGEGGTRKTWVDNIWVFGRGTTQGWLKWSYKLISKCHWRLYC